jgi:hypothetical protein
MSDKTLTDAKEYFSDVVQPNVQEFLSKPSTFRLAFNAASSLFHLHEWLFESKKTDLEHHFGRTFSSKGDFWGHVESVVPEAPYIRDLANASKHVRLTIRPSTSMTHVANTVIQFSGYGQGGYGQGRFGGGDVVMKDRGADILLDDCASKLLQFWSGVVTALYP